MEHTQEQDKKHVIASIFSTHQHKKVKFNQIKAWIFFKTHAYKYNFKTG